MRVCTIFITCYLYSGESPLMGIFLNTCDSNNKYCHTNINVALPLKNRTHTALGYTLVVKPRLTMNIIQVSVLSPCEYLL